MKNYTLTFPKGLMAFTLLSGLLFASCSKDIEITPQEDSHSGQLKNIDLTSDKLAYLINGTVGMGFLDPSNRNMSSRIFNNNTKYKVSDIDVKFECAAFPNSATTSITQSIKDRLKKAIPTVQNAELNNSDIESIERIVGKTDSENTISTIMYGTCLAGAITLDEESSYLPNCINLLNPDPTIFRNRYGDKYSSTAVMGGIFVYKFTFIDVDLTKTSKAEAQADAYAILTAAIAGSSSKTKTVSFSYKGCGVQVWATGLLPIGTTYTTEGINSLINSIEEYYKTDGNIRGIAYVYKNYSELFKLYPNLQNAPTTFFDASPFVKLKKEWVEYRSQLLPMTDLTLADESIFSEFQRRMEASQTAITNLDQCITVASPVGNNDDLLQEWRKLRCSQVYRLYNPKTNTQYLTTNPYTYQSLKAYGSLDNPLISSFNVFPNDIYYGNNILFNSKLLIPIYCYNSSDAKDFYLTSNLSKDQTTLKTAKYAFFNVFGFAFKEYQQNTVALYRLRVVGNGKVRHVVCLEDDKAACEKAGWIVEEIIGYVPTDASNLPLYGKMNQ